MRIGTCLQIGLQQSTEYLYLTDTNWREQLESIDPILRIPESVCEDIETWRYIGVDQDPNSIAHLCQMHGAKGRWITAQVGSESGALIEINSHLWGDDKFQGLHATVLSLEHIINGFGLNPLDVLAMDIEGMEFGVLRDYSWIVKPRFITVEIHSYESIQSDVQSIIEDVGYSLLSLTPTNIGNRYPTIEAKYIL